MKSKLLIISTLYQKFLKDYYIKYPTIISKSYTEQYQHLLNDASEFVSSYTRTFNEIGINTKCIISNAKPLQNTWLLENKLNTKDEKSIILEQIKDFKPNVLWIENKNLIDSNFLKQIKSNNKDIKLIFTYHCAPYSNKDADNLKLLDFVLTCTPGFQKKYEKQGIKSYLVYHAFDSKILDKLSNKKKNESFNNLVFSGSLFLGGGFHNERTKLIEKIIKKNIDIKIYGNLEKRNKIVAKQTAYYLYKILNKIKLKKYISKIPILNKFENYAKNRISYYSNKLIKSTETPVFGIKMLELLKNAKITLNIHGEVAGNYAGNMKLFEATGVGSCLLTDNKLNMSELFTNNKEVVVYNGFDDCIDKINWLLNNEEERASIAKAGQIKTLKIHTVENRCKLIVDIINDELKNITK